MNTRIGIIGDYNPANPTHAATSDALQHSADYLGEGPCEAVWLRTDLPQDLGHCHGLLLSPGSPYQSLENALLGVQYAREHQVPFLGTCGGFQHMVLEYARNVMGIREAAHAESNPDASCLFITALSCSLVGQTMEVCLEPGTKAAALYESPAARSARRESGRANEKYYCSFGLNAAYRKQLEAAGLVVSATDDAGEVRIMELASHPFFVGTLFVPQAGSTKSKPHPVVTGFYAAATRKRQEMLL
jgi:CTP synthase (UTP-ammonia lyase)